MLCQGCHFPAEPGFAFCPKCGDKLEAACPACGYACPPDFAFCPKCGTRLAEVADGLSQPAPTRLEAPSAREHPALSNSVEGDRPAEQAREEGERRPVTVLFADLSGFTTLSEAFDPEQVAALLDRCLGAMTEAVDRFGGTIDKYIGDCVMALFGAPVAHEDDAERAILAALEMHERIADISRQLAAQSRGEGPAAELALSLHVGINTGLVVAGAVGSVRRRDYTVLGDAVNVAARLQSEAQSGEIVVGATTYQLARHAFRFDSLGQLSLKGKGNLVAAYRVLARAATPESGRGLERHGLTTPLVGREAEIEQLLAAFEDMLRGRTEVVSIVGEAGLGKSRLLRELLSRLEHDGRVASTGVKIRRAVCAPLGWQAYGVVAALFHDAYRLQSDDPPERVLQTLAVELGALGGHDPERAPTVPLIGRVMGLTSDDPRLRHLEPEQVKRQLMLAVREVVELRLRQGPLMLVVEDLHWADAASVELLRFLADRLCDRPLMLLLVYRPDFDGSGFSGGGSIHREIRLEPLSGDESRTLLSSVFGSRSSGALDRLWETVVARADGNPLYLEEVIRALLEAGALETRDGRWKLTADVTSLTIPPTIQGLLLARLDRLPGGARRLVQEAAVLGLSFSAELLRQVCSEPRQAEAQLRVLCDAELLAAVPGIAGAVDAARSRFRFTHPLLHEVAYESLLLRRRTELHGRAGLALEALVGGQPERLEDLEALGRHFSASADRVKGARYLVAAGDWSRAIYANEDAARQYRRALEAFGACDVAEVGREQLLVRERLGEVLVLSGHRDEALGHYLDVLTACEERGDRAAQARLRRRIGGVYWDAGERDRAREHYQAALELLDGSDAHIELAHLYQERGRLAFRSGEPQEAIQWAERALALAAQLKETTPALGAESAAVIAQAHSTLGIALARTGASEQAIRHLELSLATAQEHNLHQAAGRAFANLGVLYSTLDPAQAIQTSLAGLELAKKIGDLGLQPWLYANLAGAYCTFTGRCEDEGIAAAHAAIELDRQLGQLDHLAVPLIVLGQIYQCHGEPSLALRFYEEARNLAEGMGEPQLLFPCYDGLATLYLELGDDARAEQYLVKSQQVCDQAGLAADSLTVLPFLG